VNTLKSIYYTAIIAISFVLMMHYGKFVLIPMAFGILLAVLFDPFVIKIKKYLKFHSVTFLVTVIGFIVLLILPFYFIANTVFGIFASNEDNTTKIKSSVEAFTNNMRYQFLGKFFDRAKVESLIESAISYLQELVGYFIADGMSALTNILLAILFSYFLHAYFYSTKRLLIKSSDRKAKVRLKKLIKRVPEVIRSYVFGTLIVMCVIAFLSSLLFLGIGLEHAILWGAIIGFMTIIPYIGSAIGITLPMAFSLIQNQSVDQILIIGVGYLFIQFIEGNFITPKIVGDKVGVNPFIIIVCMMIMAKLWGIAGVMITIPMIAVLKIFLEEYGHEFLSELVFETKESSDDAKPN
jgi:predicted PurR-regulated permease PerM